MVESWEWDCGAELDGMSRLRPDADGSSALA